jgi:hypothetical protein
MQNHQEQRTKTQKRKRSVTACSCKKQSTTSTVSCDSCDSALCGNCAKYCLECDTKKRKPLCNSCVIYCNLKPNGHDDKEIETHFQCKSCAVKCSHCSNYGCNKHITECVRSYRDCCPDCRCYCDCCERYIWKVMFDYECTCNTCFMNYCNFCADNNDYKMYRCRTCSNAYCDQDCCKSVYCEICDKVVCEPCSEDFRKCPKCSCFFCERCADKVMLYCKECDIYLCSDDCAYKCSYVRKYIVTIIDASVFQRTLQASY